MLILKDVGGSNRGLRQVINTLFTARKINVEPDLPPGTSALQVRSAPTQADLRCINSFTLFYFKVLQPFILIHFRICVYL